MFVQPVERASQAIVVEIFCLDPFTKQKLKWLVFKVLRNQVQPPIAEPSSIEDHCHRRCPDTYVPLQTRFLVI